MMISPEGFYVERRSPEMGFRPFCVLQDCDTTNSVVKSNYPESGRCLFMTDAQQREAADRVLRLMEQERPRGRR